MALILDYPIRSSNRKECKPQSQNSAVTLLCCQKRNLSVKDPYAGKTSSSQVIIGFHNLLECFKDAFKSEATATVLIGCILVLGVEDAILHISYLKKVAGVLGLQLKVRLKFLVPTINAYQC